MRYYFENRKDRTFINLLKEKYGFGRSDMHKLEAENMYMKILLFDAWEKLWEMKRFDFKTMGKSDEEMVEELCDMIDGKFDENITIDHICALYESCKKMDDGEKSFIEIIRACAAKGMKFN